MEKRKKKEDERNGSCHNVRKWISMSHAKINHGGSVSILRKSFYSSNMKKILNISSAYQHKYTQKNVFKYKAFFFVIKKSY